MLRNLTNFLVKLIFGLAILGLLAAGALSPAAITQADGGATSALHIVKYAADGTSIITDKTVDYQWMQDNLPVQGDGVTHYYHQGPVFEGDQWDPQETANLKDKGAVMGTAVKDLCDLVGGMSPGDTVRVKAVDGLYRQFTYADVYTPQSNAGPIGICWYTKNIEGAGPPLYPDGAEVPAFSDGMQLVFFAPTTNALGQHVFGNQDMRDCLPQTEWYYFDTDYPSTNGLSVKWVSDVIIYSQEAVPVDMAFYGTVTINGNPAPVNTTIEARGTNVLTGIPGNPIFTSEVGYYGSTNASVPNLVVQGDIDEGTIISFYINGVAGDQTATWPGSLLNEMTLTVTISTTTTLTSSVNPSAYGQAVTFTAIIDSNATNFPTGTVTFKDGDNTLGFGSLTSGRAQYSTTTLSPGPHAIAAVFGGDDRFGSSSATLTQTVASPSGGGGGGGNPVPTTTATTTPTTATPSILPVAVIVDGKTTILPINPSGEVLVTVTESSPDGQVKIVLPQGTVITLPPGVDLTTISVEPIPQEQVPPPPPDQTMIGIPYDCEPSGATFSPPIALVWSYDGANLPSGVNEMDLTVAFYEETKATWMTVPHTVDPGTHTITAQVAHFTDYQVMVPKLVITTTPLTTATSTRTTSPLTTLTQTTVISTFSNTSNTLPTTSSSTSAMTTPTSSTPSPVTEDDSTSFNWLIIAALSGAMVIIVLVVIFTILRKRGSRH
jgi:hypothetical protein